MSPRLWFSARDGNHMDQTGRRDVDSGPRRWGGRHRRLCCVWWRRRRRRRRGQTRSGAQCPERGDSCHGVLGSSKIDKHGRSLKVRSCRRYSHHRERWCRCRRSEWRQRRQWDRRCWRRGRQRRQQFNGTRWHEYDWWCRRVRCPRLRRWRRWWRRLWRGYRGQCGQRRCGWCGLRQRHHGEQRRLRRRWRRRQWHHGIQWRGWHRGNRRQRRRWHRWVRNGHRVARHGQHRWWRGR